MSCKLREVYIAIKDDIGKRQNDPWAVEVKGRLELLNDLRAEDALYHADCNTRFRFGKEKTNDSKTPNISRKQGHPRDEDREAAFEEIVDYLIKNDYN